MSCELDIDDIVVEMAKQGNITVIAELPVEQVAGVLTAVVKTVDQASDVISTAKGLGSYGLSLGNLQLTGVVKCGFDFDQDIITALSDASIFTGKHGVHTVEDLTGPSPTSCETTADKIARERAEGLQQSLMVEVITSGMNDLQMQGGYAADSTDQERASLAGQSSKFSPFEILGNIAGTIGDVLGAAMDSLGALAAVAALIAVIKNADILGKLKGFGAKIASIPELLTDTVDMADTDADADSIVGSSRIASINGGDVNTVPDTGNKYSGKYI